MQPQRSVSAPRPPQRLDDDQITTIVRSLGGLLAVIRQADPRDKAELYSRISLRMTYQPGGETLKAEVVSDDFGRVLRSCPEPNTAAVHTVIASRELTCAT